MRNLWLVLLIGSLVIGWAGPARAGELDPTLEVVLEDVGDQEVVSALLFLDDYVDLAALDRQLTRERATPAARHEAVVTALRDKAAATQTELLDELKRLYVRGEVAFFQPFWIANMIRIDAPRAVIQELATRADVGMTYLNYEIESVTPVHTEPCTEPPGMRTPEPGLVAIRAPEAWALGYDGTGVLVSSLDTGVAGSHAALASRWRGVADARYTGHPGWALFDPVTHWTFPQDSGSHGTHTMGTICGGPPGDQVGVAPGAQWIHAAVIDRVSLYQTCTDAILAFQWIVDPDENPSTFWDVPTVCSNSWGIRTSHSVPPYNAPCDPSFWGYLDACEAAGVVVVFAAGNEGSSANTLRRPSDRATDDYRTCAVAAVDGNSPPSYPIASFSSRGPTYCTPTGAAAIKPEVAAPGVSVRSSVPSGYSYSDGTSMATPHVAGVVALIRQACPDLTVQEVKDILYETAVDLGTAGDDNSYGHGLVNAYAAVLLAEERCGPRPPEASDGEFTLPWNTSLNIPLVADDDGLPEVPGALSYVITSLPSHGRLSDPDAGAINTAPYTLVGGGHTVVYLPFANYWGADGFEFLADDGGVPPEGGESNVATIDLTVVIPPAQLIHAFPLDTNPGWTCQGQWAFGQPAGLGSHNSDPTTGHTGPNVYGYNLNGDYANWMGATEHLTTTAIDCTNQVATELRFRRWLGVERVTFDHATVEVSANGANWVKVWENGPTSLSEAAWSLHTLDISAVADGESTVYVRWGMGPTDGSVTYPGWNLDDIQIWGVPTLPALHITGSNPPTGAIDACTPIHPTTLEPRGWESVELTFNRTVDGLTPGAFVLTETCLPGECDQIAPAVQQVAANGAAATLTFNRPLDPNAWTVVSYVDGDADDVIRLGFLPGDVDGSRTVSASDLIAVVNNINAALGGGHPAAHQTDIDRSGTVIVADMIVLVNMLNGAPPFEACFGNQLPPLP